MKPVAVLPVQIGDLVKDCDPRSNGRVKVVTDVAPVKITVASRHSIGSTTQVSRTRVHSNPVKKSGYYLVPSKENV